VVTRGPEYANFRGFVNGQPGTISFLRTEVSKTGKLFRAITENMEIFSGPRRPDTELDAGQMLVGHTVARISLGDFDLERGVARVALQAVDARPDQSAIGVDQWMLTPVKKQGRTGVTTRE
jgi:hypothetical protein